MNESAVVAITIFLLWLLRRKEYPLKLTIYLEGRKWSVWGTTISKRKQIYENTEAHPVEIRITNNGQYSFIIYIVSTGEQFVIAPLGTLKYISQPGAKVDGMGFVETEIEILVMTEGF